jgi:hypothetical protein
VDQLAVCECCGMGVHLEEALLEAKGSTRSL